MVYYIRFFKPPRFIQRKGRKTRSVTAVVTIQNDLGELFLQQATKLNVQLLRVGESENEDVYREQVVDWLGQGAQSLNITLDSISEGNLYKVYVSEHWANAAEAEDSYISRILPAWSAASQYWEQAPESLIERRFILPRAPEREKDGQDESPSKVRIWEETGNSIACHIWSLNARRERDAALGSILLFHHLLNASLSEDKEPLLPKLHAHLNEPHHLPSPPATAKLTASPSPPGVIELGSGTGLAGIFLSKLFPNLGPILLTDLPEAQDLLSRNISFNTSTPSHHDTNPTLPNDFPSVSHAILPWGEPPPLATEPIDLSKIHLIVSSDVIYNPTSYILLIQTFISIVSVSDAPHILVLVGRKRRHESEEAFFGEMSKARFRVVESAVITLPAIGDLDGDGIGKGGERVEFRVFELER